MTVLATYGGKTVELRRQMIGLLFLSLGVLLLLTGLYWANIAAEETVEGLAADRPLLYSGLALAAMGFVVGVIGFFMLLLEYFRQTRDEKTEAWARQMAKWSECPECGHKNPPGFKYCGGCAVEL
ncbi:unnamed protein product [marine sediment metagenome]|uniref:Zinc-ribbon domain-containing protein n=1 Tax=marine sediment metagenome TaxID=412755 RepID=X1CVM8_9ZZZZ